MTLSRLLPVASLALLAGCFIGPTEPTEPTEPEVSRGVPVGLDAAQVAVVQQGVRGALRNPDSAWFGPMSAARGPDGTVVCGYVNARNRFGRSGRTPFVGHLETDIFLVAAIGGGEFSPEAVARTCVEFGASI